MKFTNKADYLPPLALACGIITYLLRTFLWISGIGNDDAYLPTGTWPDILSWVMVAVTAAISGVGVLRLRGLNTFSGSFSPSIWGAVGMILAGVGFCITSLMELSGNADNINIIAAALGFPAAISLWILAYARMKRRRFSIAFHSIVCVYLMLHLVSHYRLWSSYPQLQTYAFELLAIVFVMLSCYHRAAFDADSGSPRSYMFFTLLAIFFCVATLPSCDNPLFFLGCAAWLYLTPCKLNQSPRKEE